jgi:hypothetical protein
LSTQRHAPTWMKMSYYVAVTLAMIGWLSLFVWLAMQIF